MLPLISLYQSSSFSLRSVLRQWHYAVSIQRYSSSNRSPIPPSMNKSTTTQTFDGMIDFRRQQARRTVLIHVKYRSILFAILCSGIF
jgi:hypothetical protein